MDKCELDVVTEARAATDCGDDINWRRFVHKASKVYGEQYHKHLAWSARECATALTAYRESMKEES